MSRELRSQGIRLLFTIALAAQFMASAGAVRSSDNQDTALTYPSENSVKPLVQTVRPQNVPVKSPTTLAGTWQTYTTSNSNLPGNYILGIAEDPNQNLRVSMQVSYYCGGNPGYDFKSISISGGSAIVPIDVSVFAKAANQIAPVANGDIWMGMVYAPNSYNLCNIIPVRVLHPNDSQQDYYPAFSGLIGYDVRAIIGDSTGNVWFGTTSGVSVLHPDGTWRSYTSENSGLVSSVVLAINIDSSQNVWIGTNAGVSELHADGNWSSYTTATSGLAYDNVNSIMFSATDVWFGTSNGLSVLHVDGTWQSYTTVNSGLVNNNIQSMVLDGDFNIWIGTPTGLSVLHADGTWQTYTTANSVLGSNNIVRLIQDSGHNIWIGTWGGGLTEYGKLGSQFDRISLSASGPTTVDISSLVYVTVTLNGATSADDISGLQFSMSASGMTPATDQPIRMGSLIPSANFSRTTSTGYAWQFMLSLPVTSHDVINGDGFLAAFPFYASGVSMHGWFRMDDHLLLNHLTDTVYNHINAPQQIAVGSWGDLSSRAYLQTRPAFGQGGIGVDLSGAQGHYTAVTNPTGQLTFTQINSGTYTARLTHALYVAAVRPFTITGSVLTVPPDTGLWAGDMNQDSSVDNTDWYICAAASIPVSDPGFDITLDHSTDVRDCMYVASNIGRADMSTTDAPRTGFGPLPLAAQRAQAPVSTAWTLALAPLASGDWSLRSSGVNGFLYASGSRLSLPYGATVVSVTLSGGFMSGYLNWHQDGSSLYIVATPGTWYVPMRDTDIAVIHLAGATAGQLAVDAQNMIGVPGHTFYLPIGTRH